MNIIPSSALAAATDSAFAIVAMALLAAALHDIAFRTVPNWIPILLILVGSLMRIMNGTFVLGLIVGAFIFFINIYCWHRNWLGGGDVKLFAAVAVLVPPALAVNLVLDVALSGGVLAILYLILAQLVTRPSLAQRPNGLFLRVWRVEHHRIYRRGSLPYASAIVAGALLVLLKE